MWEIIRREYSKAYFSYRYDSFPIKPFAYVPFDGQHKQFLEFWNLKKTIKNKTEI